MMLRFAFATTVLAGLFLGAAPVSADFVDNFDTENGGVPSLNYANFANFNVTAGAVDLLGPGLFDFYPGNDLYVDLNGSSGVSGSLSSKLLIDPGSYEFSFEIGNNPLNSTPNSMTVSLGDYQETFTRAGSVALETITRTVLVTTASHLEFTTLASDNDNDGIIIDAISVRTSPVPEPASLVLLGVGGFGVFLQAGRRRSKASAGSA